MVWALFFLGMLGAVLTIYLAKQEVIPEFRPLFDTLEKEKEAKTRQGHIKETEEHIDRIQAELEVRSLPKDYSTRLMKLLESSQDEVRDETQRLQHLEKDIKQGQVISRSIGFLVYIVLGGVFAALLASSIEIEGLSGDLPDYFKSIVIGATWTSYLSVIGFSQVGKKVDEKIHATKEEIMRTVAKMQQTLPGAAPSEEMAVIEAAFDETAQIVQRDMKRLL